MEQLLTATLHKMTELFGIQKRAGLDMCGVALFIAYAHFLAFMKFRLEAARRDWIAKLFSGFIGVRHKPNIVLFWLRGWHVSADGIGDDRTSGLVSRVQGVFMQWCSMFFNGLSMVGFNVSHLLYNGFSKRCVFQWCFPTNVIFQLRFSMHSTSPIFFNVSSNGGKQHRSESKHWYRLQMCWKPSPPLNH